MLNFHIAVFDPGKPIYPERADGPRQRDSALAPSEVGGLAVVNCWAYYLAA